MALMLTVAQSIRAFIFMPILQHICDWVLVLLAMSADLIFHHEHNDTCKLLDFTLKQATLEWSTLLTILKHSGDLWGPNGGLGWLHSSVMLNKDLYCKFALILASFETRSHMQKLHVR